MDKISKAIGAAQGGALGGAVLGATAVPFLPEGTPWYGYTITMAVSIVLPAVSAAVVAYLSPKNAA
jgi:hypothetical protein